MSTSTVERSRPGQWWTALSTSGPAGVDFWAHAQPGSSAHARVQSGDLRAYTSSLPGWLSIVLCDHNGEIAGTRLTLDQAKALREALDLHIAATEGDQS